MAQHNITGQQGEDQAAQYLINKGYRIVARNWHNRGRKELDIVAEDGHTLVFVEVKTRRDGSLSSPLGAVTPAKMYRLSQGVRGTGAADPLNFSLPYYGSYRLQIVAV